MPQPILYIDTSRIREGKLDELATAMNRLAAFVEANIPRVISYAFYLDDSRSRMTVVALHPDSASLEFHMDAGAAEFRKFKDLIELSKIEIYGEVTEAALERLYRKARMLGHGTVTIHAFYVGFRRC